MTDSEFKTRALQGLAPIEPVVGGLAPGSVLRWPPVGAAMRASDTIPATSRRIVAEWSLSGASDWAQPDGSTDPVFGSNRYPEDNVWRTLATRRANVTPGCELRAYAIASPSGLAVHDLGGGLGFQSAGAWAQVRVSVTWSNVSNTSGPHTKSAAIAGSPEGTYGGLEASEAGANWTNAILVDLGRHSPATYTSDPDITSDFAEWSTVAITIDVLGGARIQQIVVYEHPLSYASDHDNDGLVSVHAMPPSFAPLTPGPLTKSPDGPTYEEHRFGSRRMMQVAERQSERLGPRIMEWGSWDESDSNIWDQAEGNPATTSSTSFSHIVDSTIANTDYGIDTPGWIVASGYAKLARLCDPSTIGRNEIAAVPVRVRVDASRATANGIVRVQSGPYDYVDVTVTGGRAIYTATGTLQGQVHPDDPTWPLVVWIRSLAGGTLSVYAVSVDFGHWTSGG